MRIPLSSSLAADSTLDRLRGYILSSHRLMFENEYYYDDTPHFYDRFKKQAYDQFPRLWGFRRAFLYDYGRLPGFADAYHRYMREQLDFVAHTTLTQSAPNQKRHPHINEISGTIYTPFVTAMFQMVLWEFAQRRSFVTVKARETKISYTMYSGLFMLMEYKPDVDVKIYSDKLDKVDLKGDKRQCHLGRLDDLYDQSKIFTREHFGDRKLKRFQVYKDRGALEGSPTTATEANQKRINILWDDEAGLQQELIRMIDELTHSADLSWFTGTLSPGFDDGLQVLLDAAAGYEIDIKEIIALYTELVRRFSGKYTYREIWQSILAYKLANVPKEQIIGIPVNIHHDPIKRGGDVREQLVISVHRRPSAIASQIDADRFAVAEERSFWEYKPEVHLKDDRFFKRIARLAEAGELQWLLGFDPGALKKAYVVPIATDNQGRYYVFPAEQLRKGNMFFFIKKMMKRYPKAIWYPEKSAKAYSSVGGGWYYKLRKHQSQFGYQVILTDNRQPDRMLDIVNEMLTERLPNPVTGEREAAIFVAKSNKSWIGVYNHTMKGLKGSHTKLSHPSDAFISVIAERHWDVIYDLEQKTYELV